jgi:hypothetical protein
MNIEPVLTVLEPNPPTLEITCATSGSACTTLDAASCRSLIAGNEMSCGPSLRPISMPVSCWGNSPDGICVYSHTVIATVATVRSPTTIRCRSTTRSNRP